MASGTSYSVHILDPLKGDLKMLPDAQKQAVKSNTGNQPNNFPRDHLVWSIFNFVHFNFCCLGFLALIYSVKARDRKNVGDITAASSYGSTAKILNIISLLLSLCTLILIIVLFATGIIVLHKEVSQVPWNVNSGK